MRRRFAGIYNAPSRELIYGSKYAENVYVGTYTALLPAVDIRYFPLYAPEHTYERTPCYYVMLVPNHALYIREEPSNKMNAVIVNVRFYSTLQMQFSLTTDLYETYKFAV